MSVYGDGLVRAVLMGHDLHLHCRWDSLSGHLGAGKPGSTEQRRGKCLPHSRYGSGGAPIHPSAWSANHPLSNITWCPVHDVQGFFCCPQTTFPFLEQMSCILIYFSSSFSISFFSFTTTLSSFPGLLPPCAASARCQWLWCKPGSGSSNRQDSCLWQALAQHWWGAQDSNKLNSAPTPGANHVPWVCTFSIWR